MKNTVSLPEGYRELERIDLQKNKKQAVLVNVLSLVIAALMVVPAALFVPISTLFAGAAPWWLLLKMAVLLVGMVAYIILHELVHGIFMRAFSGVRPHYGFTGLYAFAGSEVYFNKVSYITIALAPVVIWGAVLGVLLCLIPTAWFWVVYLIEIINISGAAGDFYVTVRMCRMPREILVQDSGVSMRVFSPCEKTE